MPRGLPLWPTIPSGLAHIHSSELTHHSLMEHLLFYLTHLLFYLTHLPLGSSRAHSLPYSTFGSVTTSTEAAFWTLKLGKAPLNPSFP